MRAVDRWELGAERWVQLVRDGGDSTFAWNCAAFLELVPPPGTLTVDVGAGEGRLARTLAAAGHHVTGIDASPTLVRYAREADPGGDYRLADASALPLAEGAADLVVAFNSLQDIEDASGALEEAARVLTPGGVLCFSIVHPIATAAILEEHGDAPRFVLERAYCEPAAVERPLGAATIVQYHRPIAWYAEALEAAGFRVEALHEIPTRRKAPGWIPMFLHVRARSAD